MKKFKLLKDTVKSKSGNIFTYQSEIYPYYRNAENGEVYAVLEVEGNKNWFEEIIEKKWSWEKCFDGNGVYIDSNSNLFFSNKFLLDNKCKNVFATEKQAKQVLAFAQLSHIVKKANTLQNGKVFDANTAIGNFYKIVCSINSESNVNLEVLWTRYKEPLLNFYSLEIAKEVLEENQELIKMYFEVG
jgi:hypothetical protein